MHQEILNKLRDKIEKEEGIEQPIETMTFTYNEMLDHIEFYENELVKKIIGNLKK